MSTTLHYKKGYKYQLAVSLVIMTPIKGVTIDAPYYSLDDNGLLHIYSGYAWDGPSGPALDTKDFMRASLVHDCLYQMLAHGELAAPWKRTADEFMRAVCLQDGMPKLRAWYAYKAVSIFGKPEKREKIIITYE